MLSRNTLLLIISASTLCIVGLVAFVVYQQQKQLQSYVRTATDAITETTGKLDLLVNAFETHCPLGGGRSFTGVPRTTGEGFPLGEEALLDALESMDVCGVTGNGLPIEQCSDDDDEDDNEDGEFDESEDEEPHENRPSEENKDNNDNQNNEPILGEIVEHTEAIILPDEKKN